MTTPSTPRTDAVVKPYIGEVDNERILEEADKLLDHARQLERELAEALKWKNEDPRMLREQIRVADVAFNHLTADRDRWRKMAEELAVKVEWAMRRYRLNFSRTIDGLKTDPTPYDEIISRFNAMKEEQAK